MDVYALRDKVCLFNKKIALSTFLSREVTGNKFA